MKKEVRLYNLIFPIWMLLLLPASWLVVLPANFAVDTAVLLVGMKALGLADKKGLYKQTIWKVWALGFVADLLAAGLMLAVLLSDYLAEPGSAAAAWLTDKLVNPVSYNPFETVWAFLWVLLCVAVGGLLVYWFNVKISLRKTPLEEGQKKRLAVLLALVTAPWLFFLPTAWFF